MPLVSQDHVLVGLLGLLVLSLYFNLEFVILCLCAMSRTASTTLSPVDIAGGVYCEGVWSGAQGSRSVQCVLPGPLGSIITGVLRISVSSSSSCSEADGSPGGNSAVSSSNTSSL